jgi:DNA-binding transcriptional ArsR family regulator
MSAARAIDQTLLALAHPTRREILQRLSGGETRVTDLAAPFAVSLKSVSLHIRVLEDAGLVARRRVGRQYLISLDTGPLDSVALWLTQTAALWKFRLNRLSTLLDDEQEGIEKKPEKRGATRRKGSNP